MTFPARLRLVVATLLFMGWIGFLALQAWPTLTKNPTPVLSRPQFLFSELAVVVRIDDPSKPVVVEEVLASRLLKPPAVGDSLTILNLSGLKLPQPDASGCHILLLRSLSGDDRTFLVTPIPSSPGHREDSGLRIYPATEAVRAQLAQLQD